MKQKCQILMGIVKYKNTAAPLCTSGINTTHQHFKMSSKVTSQSINTIYLTMETYKFKLRWLVTFKLLKLKQSYIPHLKVLMCGIDA